MLTSIEEFGEIFSSVNGIVKMEKSGGKELIQLLTYFSKLQLY